MDLLALKVEVETRINYNAELDNQRAREQKFFSVAKATLESLMSSEGMVISNLGCGYIENGVVILKYPSVTKTPQPLRIMLISQITSLNYIDHYAY